MDRLKLFIPLIIFVVLATVLYIGLDRDPNAMPSALVDKAVPPFTLAALSQASEVQQDLDESLFMGEPALLNVWATWCVACRLEHPFLMEIAAQGVRIIGLNYKDEASKARQWLVDFGDPYELVISDPAGKLGLDLGVFGAPETYLVDAEGMIRYKHVGVVDDRVWQTEIAPVFYTLRGEDAKPLPRRDD